MGHIVILHFPSGQVELDKYFMQNENSSKNFETWASAHRARMEPIIKQRFADRGRTDDEAERFIAGVCWDDPIVQLRRIAAART